MPVEAAAHGQLSTAMRSAFNFRSADAEPGHRDRIHCGATVRSRLSRCAQGCGMLFLLAAAAAAAVPATDTAKRRATATVRIVAPARASRRAWNETPPVLKRELIVREADGRRTLVRVIEFE